MQGRMGALSACAGLVGNHGGSTCPPSSWSLVLPAWPGLPGAGCCCRCRLLQSAAAALLAADGAVWSAGSPLDPSGAQAPVPIAPMRQLVFSGCAGSPGKLHPPCSLRCLLTSLCSSHTGRFACSTICCGWPCCCCCCCHARTLRHRSCPPGCPLAAKAGGLAGGSTGGGMAVDCLPEVHRPSTHSLCSLLLLLAFMPLSARCCSWAPRGWQRAAGGWVDGGRSQPHEAPPGGPSCDAINRTAAWSTIAAACSCVPVAASMLGWPPPRAQPASGGGCS